MKHQDRLNEARRLKHEALIAAGILGPNCPDCGGPKYRFSMRCKPCDLIRRAAVADPDGSRRYYREYMREWRSLTPEERAERLAAKKIANLLKRPIEIQRCRAGKRTCENWHEIHHHCDCGIPISMDRVVCSLCIAEASRVEVAWYRRGVMEIAEVA
jgi:hypothetical protein